MRGDDPRTWVNRSRIDLARVCQFWPTEIFSGYARHHESRAHAPISIDFLVAAFFLEISD
jgi:hypothetical protein